MTDIPRLVSGSKIKSLHGDSWNRFREATLAVERQGGALSKADGVTGKLPAMPVDVINHTGEARTAHQIVGLEDVEFEPDGTDPPSQQLAFKAVVPKEDLSFGVLLGRLESGEESSAEAAAMGYVWARVDIKAEEDETCGVEDDTVDNLVSGKGSTPIMWKPDGTGVKWCVVQLGGGGGGERRSVGTASGIALCVKDIPAAELPDLTGLDVADWCVTPGQEGPPADRASDFGESGATPTAWTDRTGVVLVDWKRNYDTADPSTYQDAPYAEPKVDWCPIVEKFGDDGFHVGGGLGGEEGEGSGASNGGGGGI